MSKNIVLAGLQYDNNLGDQAIYMCAYKMLQSLLIDHGICDIEIRKVDLTGRYAKNKNIINRPFRYLKKLDRKLGYKSGLASLPEKEARYVCSRLAGKYIDSDTAAVIFAGGGIVKFKYQQFHIYIDEFTKRADKLGVPVMMNAVGVEGYDAEDPECMLLKRALNRDCVKYISTRDDIDILSGKYCENGQITELVADPVCSLSSMRPLKKKPHPGRIIGLGTVRSGLFVDNDIDFTREDMLKFWSSLVREIKERGMQCRIFCNGTIDDMLFQDDLAEYMGLSDAEKKELMYERPTSVGQLARYINGFDAVITGRLHASIIAYSYAVPSVGLVWNDKQRMFGRITGHPERFIEPLDFNAKTVIDAVMAAIDTGYDEEKRRSFPATTSAFMDRFVRDYLTDKESSNPQ